MGNKIFNVVKRLLGLAILVLAVLFLMQRTQWFPSFDNWFKRKPLLIENSPLVITQVKNIAQLQTIQLYADVVADSSVLTTAGIANQTLRGIGIPTLPFTEKKTLVLIIRGRVIAGIDLKKLKDEQVFVKDDSIRLVLPPAEILEVITNPAGIETFAETGTWSEAEVLAVKNSARRRLLEKAASQQLLQQASDRARVVIEQFLSASGFKKINIETPAG